ncbi:GMC family oxidoreductase N-terminal domain-containing protein [bacterium]|nr:GMC family oxidoreductase N-terminal domain-containing protein [bacterium]
MKKAIVVGSGAGGATVAKELQGTFDVTVLEAGREFYPLKLKMPLLEKVKKTGLLFSEREIQLIFSYMKIRKTEEGMILVNGIGLGGTTALSTGNALRIDKDLKSLGIDLNDEFEEIYQEIPITTDHQNRWSRVTTRLFEISREINLNPQSTPKMGNFNRCTNCGRCVFGCSYGAKWDSRRFLEIALNAGANLIMKCKVKKVVIKDGRVTGVLAKKGLSHRFYPADLVILAAGGLATPVILQNSGIDCEKNLFVDPVLCVAMEYKNSHQCKEIPMPFIVQKEHYILSPYFDYLSYFFNKAWKYPAKDIVGIMIKLADSNKGSISNKKLNKILTDQDKKRLNEGVEICTEILSRLGGEKNNIFLGTINAGHPGGMLPLTIKEADTFHHDRLPENLYIADSTLLPHSTGNPPILTIISIAKRISKLCKGKFH